MVRFGIIGTNVITDRFLDGAVHDERFSLRAIYSRTKETADDFANRYRVNHIFTDLEDMASSRLIDAVYIASPNAFHAPQAIRFLRNGKHVLCEKAFASNAAEAEAMVMVARESGCVLMEAMKTTLLPNFGRIGNLLSSIGKIRRYSASYCQYSSRYDQFRKGVVLNAFNPELSNGALMDIGVYCIYPMVVWFGRPLSVLASGVKLSSGADGGGTIICSYPEMIATLSYSKITDSSVSSEIQGEDGNILIRDINTFRKIQFAKRKGEMLDVSLQHINDDMYYEVKEFIDIIETKRSQSTVNSWSNSLIVMEIMDEVRAQLGIVYPAD